MIRRLERGLVINAQLATLDGPDYGIIENACIAWQDGKITYAGRDPGLARQGLPERIEVIDAGGAWLTPALIDCHTHLVFAGNRATEFEQRLQGVSYSDIAKAGGGILSTVRLTRAADEDGL